MKLRTLGHATLVLWEREAVPILATDPWLVGSCYWRSWWLEHYPSEEDLQLIASTKHIYLTHDHPDHFHPPSIRRLGAQPTYLTPQFLHDRMGGHLQRTGFRSEQLRSKQWRALSDTVSVMSMPTFGDDSILLIATPEAIVVNINDARPSPAQMQFVRREVTAKRKGKRVVALSSYSSAGLANSFFRNGKRLSFVSRERFARYGAWLSRLLDADDFIPFASQVVFDRPDTRWANDFKVRHVDLVQHWGNCSTRLLPTHAELDLASGEYRAVAPEDYRGQRQYAADRAAQQVQREAAYRFTVADEQALLTKLRAIGRPVIAACFPRGLCFRLEDRTLRYSALSDRVEHASGPASAVIALPALPLAEALEHGFMADLSIPMFTRVDLDPVTHPAAVYAFVMAMLMHDTGVTRDAKSFVRWLGMAGRDHFGRVASVAQPGGAEADLAR